MALTKVFVGNLVFSTKDDELRTAFSSAAEVVSANIISRGRRPLGYGFVEFKTEADAQKAVEAMDKKDIRGRPINVELARPRDPVKEEENRQKRAVARAAAAVTRQQNPTSSSPSPSNSNHSSQPSPSSPDASATAGTGDANGRGRPRGRLGRRVPAVRRPRTQADRPKSSDTLFISNIPFSTTDEQLFEVFASLNPKSAHIVRMRNNRSRGYGFVTFADVEGQTAGLALDGHQLVPGGNSAPLKISVKVALVQVPHSPEDPTDSSSTPSPAAASTTTAVDAPQTTPAN